MARIPIFFQRTFPVETYGALHDPNAESVAARAKLGLENSRLQSAQDLARNALGVGLTGISTSKVGGLFGGRSRYAGTRNSGAQGSIDSSFGGGGYGGDEDSGYSAPKKRESDGGGQSTVANPGGPATYKIKPKG